MITRCREAIFIDEKTEPLVGMLTAIVRSVEEHLISTYKANQAAMSAMGTNTVIAMIVSNLIINLTLNNLITNDPSIRENELKSMLADVTAMSLGCLPIVELMSSPTSTSH